MKYLLSLIALSFFLFQCKNAEELSIGRTSNLQATLKLNGYYHLKYETGYLVLFFYQNGVVYKTNAILDKDDLIALDKDLLEDQNSDSYPTQLHWFWGVYKIEGSTIKINHWLPGTGGAYPAQLSEGRIINPSVIRIPWVDDQLNEFKFRQFSPKPDSTNAFIK